MTQPIFTEDYRITSYLVNLRQRAGLYAILNLVQDVGWQQAVHLGFDLAGQGLSWVFTRQKLVMERWPEWNEVITLKTWLRPAGATPFVFRDYELFVGDKKIGECTSSFTLIDSNTRKLAKPDWSSFESVWRKEGFLEHFPEKILLPKEVKDLATFEVRNSDLDLNNHVNNTKYAQWILDAVPLQTLKTADLHEYEVNFLAETLKGDLITIQEPITESATADSFFQGLRKADSKVVFTARLKVTQNE
ncbi:MAG: acyl-[acyl-carrier-protein] thioesterase [Bdellovibrionota bacterium]